ncbi:MAG TPA: PfkB family carbohydrate kinase [Candidatus Sulfotelmatobacter sp.]|nr:PfkB family carbohydrate kinase [Candidatus Sulfotelmatobacter sp.]
MVVVGRVGVDFTPASPRTSLEAASTFVRAIGGYAGNVGTGLARLGVATAVVSCVGADGHGDHVRTFLAGEGVDVAGLVRRADSRTQVAFFEAWPPDDFPVTFYRPAPAPETRLTAAELPEALLRQAPLVLVSGAMLAAEPARGTALGILGRRRATAGGRPASWTVLDLDWRPALWADPGEAPPLVRQAVTHADVVIGSDEEFAAAGLDPADALARGRRLLVVKHGAAGASVVTASGRRTVAGLAVEVVCALGAGDALAAAFTAGLVRGLDPFVALERGNAAGAIVASRLMCSTAMPTPAEIDALLARSAGRPLEPVEGRR